MTFPLWGAIGVLAAEYVAFSAAFDSQFLSRRLDGWAVAGPLGWLAVLVVSAAIGVALVVHADGLSIRALRLGRRLERGTLSRLAIHAALILLLWWISARVFAAQGPPGGSPLLWLSLWLAVGAAAFATLLAAAVPDRQGASLARMVTPALLAGGAIGFGAWLAGEASAFLWWPLGPMTLRSVDAVLRVLVADPAFEPTRSIIGTARFSILVSPQCAGFEGVGLMTVFVVSYMVLARRQLRFPQALLLVPLGAVAAWVANVLRIVGLVMVGTLASRDVAAGGFHARAGWLLFCSLALLLVLFVPRLRFFARDPTDASLDHPTGAYLLPFLVLVATSLLTGLATKTVDLLYGVRILTALGALLAFRRYYRDIAWSVSWTAVAAGLAAAAAFIALAPGMDATSLTAWHAEWRTLPDWYRSAWLCLRVAGSVVLVPVAEELAFRGYLLRRLVSVDFTRVSPAQWTWWALLGSSAAFGAIHHGWIAGAAAGLLYGATQIRTASVGQAVLAHVVSNAVVAACVIGLGQWWLWV